MSTRNEQAPPLTATDGGIMFTEQTVFIVSDDLVSSQLDGETVILELDSGVYYGLNEVGTRVWQLLHEPTSFKELRATLLTEYEVDPEECAQDLVSLLQTMSERKLIRTTDEPVE